MTARHTFQAPSVATATVDLGDVLATSSTRTPSLAEDRQHPNPTPSQDLQGLLSAPNGGFMKWG